MSEKPRTVSTVEAAVMIEDVLAGVRHQARNSLAAIRNAAFYLQRKVATTPLWQQDPRVAQFFELIEAQLGAAVEAISSGAGTPPYRREPALVPAHSIVRDAALTCRDAYGEIRTCIAEGFAHADAAELALATQRVLEFCHAHCQAGTAELVAGPVANEYRVAVRAGSEHGELPGPPWHGALGIARRIAIQSRGRFEVRASSGWLEFELFFPQQEAAP